MALAVYNPSAVVILLADVLPVEDVATGTFVQITKDIQTFSTTKTSDGIPSRIMNADGGYTVNLTLTATSRTNAYLEYLLYADQLTQIAKFPILIKDNSGSSLFTSTTCWIEDIPSLEFGDTVGVRPWKIRCADGIIHFGDNYGKSSFDEDVVNTVISALPILEGLIR